MEIEITGDPSHFVKQSVCYYREKIAKMLEIPQHKVRFEAMNKGSIILIFLILSECVAALRIAAMTKDQRLIDMGVIGVHIQGEKYISVVDTSTIKGR